MAKAKKAAAPAARKGQRTAAQAATVVDDEDDETEIPAGRVIEHEPEPEDEAEHDVFAELRGLGADDEHRFTVHRISSKPGEQQGYCATYNAGDLSLDNIREQFGGGKYRIRVTDSAGQYVTSRTVGIVALPKAPTPAAAPAAASPDIAAIISALKPQGGGDMQAMILAMMNNQAKMFEALANRQPAESLKLTDILTLINAGNKGGGASDAVATLLQGVKLGKELGGGETGMLDVARDGLGILSGLIQKDQQQPNAAPVQERKALPAGAASTSEAQPGNANQQNGDPIMLQKLQWLRQQLNVLVIHAQRQKNPELYAEVMLDNLPPFFTPEEIMERLEQADAVNQLAMLDGRVRQYAAWFEEFRKAAINLLTPDEEEQQPGPGTGGGDDA